MIKVSDLILAVGILAFFLITDEKENRNIETDEASIELIQSQPAAKDSLLIEDVYDSYADFSY